MNLRKKENVRKKTKYSLTENYQFGYVLDLVNVLWIFGSESIVVGFVSVAQEPSVILTADI